LTRDRAGKPLPQSPKDMFALAFACASVAHVMKRPQERARKAAVIGSRLEADGVVPMLSII
jgi:hypothetical protein